MAEFTKTSFRQQLTPEILAQACPTHASGVIGALGNRVMLKLGESNLEYNKETWAH